MKKYKRISVFVTAILFVSLVFAQDENYDVPDWGKYTTENGFLYAHVSKWPAGNKLIIDRRIKPRKASFLSDPSTKIKIKLVNDELTLFLPEKKADSIIKIQLMPDEDWANLKKYRNANKALLKAPKKENMVVFMGNSITEKWVQFHPEFFQENNFVGRGISGQTTSQMLLRFKQDVINLKPKVVVMHAGTNDIAGNTGPISIEQIADNIFSMAELAKAYNIKVVLASVLPASSYSWSPAIKPIEKIKDLNDLIKTFAKANGMVYLDYYSKMVNDESGLIEAYGRDTVHPNVKGYTVMEALVLQTLNKILIKY
ncbi:GDSL-type esterase/lipase family protein [Tamlana sp. 62-3]|uniref:GDSL-type esterase/lipase family protein n=1 Tax=Neotamlana sargassicola TaxID=2883125 RepID=A0A9X1I5Y8_9FLAO|nr:GDSL-type esterase/lipase family protein [Tamlana sargassicola]MCB4807913.1 GDSL-type esterase/lipase family protein [Tamlana sargassicola]